MIIEREWNEWWAAVAPKDAPEGMKREMKRAFFAGSTSLFFALMRVMDADRDPTPDDMKKMERLESELTEFKEKVLRGEA